MINYESVDQNTWINEKKYTTQNNGQLGINEIYDGKYRLVEVKAPDGYALPKGQWNIVVENGSISINAIESAPAFAADSKGNYYLSNYKPSNPPLTGGKGQIMMLIIGGVFITIGSYLLVKKRKMDF